MDESDLLLLQELGRGLPAVSKPYQVIGERCGMTGQEVLERIRVLREQGVVRKLRARINQRRVGILANALVAWKVPGKEIGTAGELLSSFPEVSHCYERKPVPGRWECTLYTVHHGRTREEVLDEIREIAGRAGGWSYTVLFSTDEFKQVPAGLGSDRS
jgi:DNA-binding Lrp family transcriptional regulator